MNLRAINGGVLAVFLLIFSCLSARCKVVCEMGPLHSSYTQPERTKTGTAQHTAMSDMPATEDCDGSMGSAGSENASKVMASANCDHHVCQHDSVLIQPEQTLKLPVFVAVLIATFHAQRLELSYSPSVAFETPPLRALSPLELNSILRI